MAWAHLGRIRWTGNSPAIYMNLYYEHRRNGANMEYRFAVGVEGLSGSSYFGYPIYVGVGLNGGGRDSGTIKNQSPSQWSSLWWKTGNWHGINATSGTVQLYFNIYSGLGNSRNETYYYDVWVLPAYPNVYNSLNSVRTQSVAVNWSADSGIDWLQYRLNGGGWVDTGGNPYSVGGLALNTYYTIQTRGRRADSGLWGEAGALGFTTLRNPYVSSSVNFTVGNNLPITVYNPDNYSIKGDLYINNVLVATRTFGTGTSFTFTFSAAEITAIYNAMPNSTQGTVKVTITTVGTPQNTTGTATINSSANLPTFTNFTFADINATTTALTGNNQKVIKGYSNVRTTISAANKAVAKNGASMVKYKVVIGEKTSEVNYSATASVSADISAVLVATINTSAIDSRGLQTTVSKAATLVDYTNITISAFSDNRENGVGSKVFFSLTGNFTAVNFGAVQNTINTIRFRYKKKSETAWSAWIRIDGKCTINNTTGRYTNKTDGTNFLPTTGNGNTPINFESVEYDFEVSARDKLSTINRTASITSGIPDWAHFKGNDGLYRIGVNKFPDASKLPNGGLDIKGDVLADNLLGYTVISSW